MEVELDDELLKDEVRVKVDSFGLCHTGLSFESEDNGAPMPTVLGHEMSGIVEAIGSDVQDIKVGDQVSSCFVQACYRCVNCLSGKSYLLSDSTGQPMPHHA